MTDELSNFGRKKRDVVQMSISSAIQTYMSHIKGMFAGDTKLTLVIRSGSLKDPIIMTNDQPEPVIAAIRKMSPGKAGLFIQ